MFGNKDYITEDQLNEAVAPLLKRLRALESQLKSMTEANKALQDRIEALEASTSTSPLQGGEGDSPMKGETSGAGELLSSLYRDEKHEEISTPLPAGEGMGERLLFLPAPTPSGSFTEWSEKEQIGKSIYELTTDGKGNGTFRLLPSADALATAMISVSQFVKPVCRIQGNTHRMPESIITVSPGEAQLKDGVWTVTKKAVVEFR